MSGWSKVMRTVLGIVIGGFSVAALAYVLGETISAPKPVLPDANLSQELPLWAQTNIAIHTGVAE